MSASPPYPQMGPHTYSFACSTCAGSGRVEWAPGQHRDTEDNDQSCPDCAAYATDRRVPTLQIDSPDVGAGIERLIAHWRENAGDDMGMESKTLRQVCNVLESVLKYATPSTPEGAEELPADSKELPDLKLGIEEGAAGEVEAGHLPGCNVGCVGDSHSLVGNETEAFWHAIVNGTTSLADFHSWLADRLAAAVRAAEVRAGERIDAALAVHEERASERELSDRNAYLRRVVWSRAREVVRANLRARASEAGGE